MKNRNSSRKFIFEQLEPRILLSADVLPISIDGALSAEFALDVPAVIETILEPDSGVSHHAVEAEFQRHEILFIDSGVSDYQQLADDILGKQDDLRQIEVVVLDGSRDGVEQISEILANYTNLDAVHILSHGADGAVQLGTTRLNQSNVDSYGDAIAGWQDSLSPEADLLLYGCNLAEGEEGRQLIDNISSLTGADVAASDDRTGQDELGGDWVLEYNAGTIESTVMFSREVQQNWVGSLANVAPTISTPGPAVNYTENNPATIIDSTVTVIDPDSADLKDGSLTVSFSAGGTANDELTIIESGSVTVTNNKISVNGRMFGDISGGTGGSPLFIFMSSTQATPADAQAVLRQISYYNTSESPSTTPRTIDFVLTDGDGGTSNTAQQTVNVSSVNDDPLVTTNSGLNLAKGATELIPNSLLRVSDLDNTPDQVTFTLIGATGNGTLFLDGTPLLAGNTFTQEDIDNELLAYTHDNVDTNPDSFTFAAADGVDGSLGSTTFDITILINPDGNDAPVLTMPGPPVNYTENDGATAIDPSATIVDVDSPDFGTGTLTVSFSAGGTVNDELSVIQGGVVELSSNNIKVNNIVVGSFSGGTGGSDLVISWLSNATPASAQAVLQSIGYRNISEAPDTTPRTVEFVLTDDVGDTSNTVQQTINVASVNDNPLVNENNALSMGQNLTGLIDDALLHLTDADNTAAEITYTLTVATGNGTLYQGVTPLAAGNTFTQADIDNDLLTYVHTAGNTNPDSFTFTAADGVGGTLGSTTFDIIIYTDTPLFNDPPVLSLPGPAVLYNQNYPATLIDPYATVVDVDSKNFKSGTLTVSFSSGGTINDELSITEGGLVTLNGTNIEVNKKEVGTFSGGTGGTPLVITWTKSKANPGSAQLVLRKIAYRNTSATPDHSQRTIDFVLTDDLGAASNAAQKTVNYINDTPTTTGITDFTVNEDAADTVINLFTAFDDIEDADSALTYTIENNTNTGLFNSTAIDGGAGTLTLDYALNQNGTADITVRATDTGGEYVETTFTVTVSAQNDEPVNTVPAAPQSTPQDTPLEFSTGNGNPISVSDVDAGSNPVLITLTATNGNLTLDWPSGTAAAVGGDIPVNPTTDGAQQNHSVVVAEDGSYVVVWAGSKTGVDTDGGIFFQRFDATGAAVGSETLVNIGSTSGAQTSPAMDMDGDGNFVVAWQSADADGEGIFARRFDTSGNPVGGEIAVNSVTTDEQTNPSIAVANDGSFVISWTGDVGSKTDVFARRFNSDGTAKADSFTVNTTTAQDQDSSKVAIDDAGNFVVTWFDSGGKDIYARTFDAAGTSITALDFVVNSYTTDWQQRPSVAMDAAGNFVVTWQSWSQEGEAGIPGVYARGFDISGIETIAEFLVNETSPGYQWFPAVSMDSDGDFVFTWQADPQVADDNDGSGIYARQYSADGTPKPAGETLVNATTAGNQSRPSMGMNSRGDFVVAWNGPDADGDGIYARRFIAPTSISFTTGDGTNDTSMVFTGTMADINTALEGLIFTPDSGFNGLATITITTNDQGYTGSGGAQSDSDVVNINVGSVSNNAPTTTGITDVTVNQNAADTVINLFTAFDDFEDADSALTYLITNNTNTALFSSTAIDGGAGTLTLDYALNQGGTADITVRATDTGGKFVETTFTVTITVNFSIVNFADDSVAENSVFTSSTPSLIGDTPIGTVTYSISGTDSGLFSVNSSTGVVSMVARDFEAPADSGSNNTYEVTLTATDDDNNSDDQTVTITVTDEVEAAAFTINNFADDSVAENSVFTSTTPSLTGDTPIGNVTWSISGTDSALFSVNSSTGVVSMVARDFEAPADSGSNNAYEVTLTATDDDANSDDQTVTITVTDEVEAAAFSISNFADDTVAENAAFTSATPSLTGDTPIGTVTYSISGTDSALFSVNSSTGVVSMVARDFEAPADSGSNNSYEVTLTATDDDGNTDDQAVTITVTDEVEAAAFSISNFADDTVAENAAFTSATPSLTGDTPIGTVTYSISGTDSALFSVNSSTGVVTMVARDFEAPADSGSNNSYEVTLTATDDDGNTDDQAVTITVTDEVEAASFSISNFADDTVAENAAFTSSTPSLTGDTPIGTVNYSISGTDSALFSVNSSTGVVTMVARDFEAPTDNGSNNTYEVTLTATDDDGNTDDQAVTITVTDEVEAAAFSISNFADDTVAENAAFTSATPSLTGDTPIGTVTWSISGTDSGLFSVNSSTGVVSMVARDYEAPADSGSNNTYEVTLTATDDDNNSATQDVIITVTDVDEVVTFSIANFADDSVAENSAFTSSTPSLTGDTPIGTVTYSISGTDSGLFSVNSSTGVVSMVARDYEAPADSGSNNTYEVTLTATDDDTNTATQDVTISVTDVDEVVTFNIANFADDTVAENSAFTSTTPSLTGDTQIGTVTYSISGTDSALFSVNSSTGVVSMVARDYEAPADSGSDNTYEVTLTATDDDGNADDQAVTITVTDLAETVNFTIDNFADDTVAENSAFTSTTPALTGDTPIGTVTYSISGTDSALFSVNSSTGVVSMVARDYEAPVDSGSNNTYEVTLTATDDDGNTDDQAVTVTVTDVAETVNFTIDNFADDSITENAAFTSSTPSLTGDTPIGNVTYSISGTDSALFSVNSSTGVISMVARDFEAPADSGSNNTYEVTLTATDDDANSDDQAVTITVTDLAETVNFTIANFADDTVAENSVFTSSTPSLTGDTPIGTVTYSISGTDSALFSVNSSTGVISMVARDFEAPADSGSNNTYEVTLTATDDDANSDDQAVTITVTDLAETVNFTIANFADDTVAENSVFTSSTPSLTGDTPIGTVTYSISGTDSALFSVNSSNGVVSMVARDFEAPADSGSNNSYEVTLTATDDDGNTDDQAVTVTVTDVAETVNFTIDNFADDTVTENSAFTSLTPSLTGDTPIGTVTYSISGTDSGLFSVNSSTGVVSMVARDFEAPADSGNNNTYEVTLTATDDDGNTDDQAVTVTVTDVAETVNFTIDNFADDTVTENSAFTSLTPSLAGDAPIGTVTYSISGTDSALFSVNSSTGVISMVARDFEAPADSGSNNTYEVTLTATDDDGNSDDQAVTITVTDVAETVNFTIDNFADDTVAENSAFTSTTPSLTGDTPIGTVTYSISGTDSGLFSVNSSTGVITMVARDFEAPADSGNNNTYEVTLTATDDDGNTDDQAVTVTVTDIAETVNFTIANFADDSVAENSVFTSTTPSLTGDTPIGTVTYSISGTDSALFSVNSSTGVVSMVARDYEAPADSGNNNTYEVTLTATDDDGNTDDQAVTVTVTDLAETVNFTIDNFADDSVAENSAFTSSTPSLTGDTPIGTVTYSISGTDSALFSVNSSTGVVSMVARDFEAPADSGSDNAYQVTLTATDDDGNTDDQAVTVTVTDVAETVNFTINNFADDSVAENSAFTSTTPSLTGDTPIGTVTYSISGTDSALFSVNSGSGVVSMVARDYEAPADSGSNNTYEVTLTATDDDGNTDDQVVTITVTDLAETVNFTIDNFADDSIAENAAFTSTTPSLTGDTPIGTVTYSISGTDSALFSVNSSTGVVTMVARDFEAPADSGSNNTYQVTLTATDDDGNSDSQAVTVTVTDVAETVNFTINNFADDSVAENSAFTSTTPSLTGDTPIGTVTYSISGTDSALFSVNSGSGVVSMVARDYEAPADSGSNNSYEVTLTATDDDGNTDDQAVTVTVTDVAETVNFTIDNFADDSIAENAAFTSTTPSLTGDIPIGTVTYSISGTDSALFSVNSSTGVVSMVARDFEAPADSGSNNSYEVTLTATDDDGNSDDQAVTVTVTDVAETVNFTINNFADDSVAENAAFTSTTPSLTGDTPIGTVTYSISGADSGLFSVNSSTGVISMVARDFEAPADSGSDNSYEVTLTATDDDGNTDDQAVTITVTDLAETVNFTISNFADDSVAENSAFTSTTPSLTGDTPIGTVTYSISGTDSALFSVNSSTGVISMVARDYEAPADSGSNNTYEVTLTATDDDSNTASQAVTVTVTDVAETVNFTISNFADDSVAENSAFTSSTPSLTGDTPVGTVTYSISGTDSALFSVNSSTGVVSMVARDFEAPADSGSNNTYEVTLTATDDDGNSDDQAVTITVTDEVEAAAFTIANFADDSVAENSAFTSSTPSLAGDAPIGNVTCSISGTDSALFSVNSSTGVVSMVARDFEAPADSGNNNTYEVTLTATDDDGNTDDQAVTVTVTDVAETVNFTIDNFADATVTENAAFTSTTPSLTGDTPIGTVTYSISGTDSGLFSVNSSTGVVSMVARDFEAPADSGNNNTYEVTLTATDDDGNTDSQAVTITVTDVAETVNFTINNFADDSVAENSAFTSSTPSLTGDTPVGTVTYSISGTDSALFSVNSSTGVVSMVARDFEAPADSGNNNTYEVTLTATDDDGNSDDQAVTVTVTDLAETVNFTISNFADDSSAENSAFTSSTPSLTGDTPVGTVTYSISGTDSALFSVNSSTGVVSMVARNYEAPADSGSDNTYEVTLTATDDDSNTTSQAVTVTVTDLAETVNFTINNFADDTVTENAAFTSTTPALTGDTPVGTVTYSISGTDNGLFSVNASTGVVSMVARDYEAPADNGSDNTYEVTLTATDDDSNTASQAVTVTVTDLAETVNFTINNFADDTVTENAAFTSTTPALTGDTPVGTVTYSISGTDSALFSVNSSTGVVSMVARDYEAPADSGSNNSYEVTLTATDDDGNTASQAVTVTVTDVADNVAPIVTVNLVTTNDKNPELTGTVDDTTATIYVTVNGNSYAATNNGDGTWTLADNTIAPSLADGIYEVVAIAIDTDSNVGSDATANELTILDTTAPVVTVNLLTTNDTTPELNGTVDDTTATIQVTVNGKNYVAGNNGNGTWTLTDNTISPALADGIYEIAVTATDPAANVGSDDTTNELTIDATAPVVTVNLLTTNDTTPELNGTVDDTTATIQVTVNGKNYVAGNNGNGTWTLTDNTISPALNDGIYEIAVTASDTAANVGSDTTTNELTVDTTAPVVTVNLLTTNDTAPALTGTVDDTAATIQVTVNGNNYIANNNGNGTWTLADNTIAPALADSIYEIAVIATDAAGNVGSDATANELTVDTTAPVVTVNLITTNDTTPELTGRVDDITAIIQVTVNGNNYAATNNGDNTWTLADNTIAPPLADGVYEIAVTATDTASNVGSDATANELTVDTIAPVVTVNLITTSDTTPELNGTVDDTGATIQVTINGNDYSATNNGDGTWTLADNTIAPELAGGSYEIAANATDAAANVGSDSTTNELTVLDATALIDSGDENKPPGNKDPEEPTDKQTEPESENGPTEAEPENVPTESEPENGPTEPQLGNAATTDVENSFQSEKRYINVPLFQGTEIYFVNDLKMVSLAIDDGEKPTSTDAAPSEPSDSSANNGIENNSHNYTLQFDNHWLDVDLRASIERTNTSIDSIEKRTVIYTATVKGATITLSSGLAIWVLRAGSLAASAISSMPVWRGFDLLPVLPLSDKKRREKMREMQSVEKDEKKEYKKVADLLDKEETKN